MIHNHPYRQRSTSQFTPVPAAARSTAETTPPRTLRTAVTGAIVAPLLLLASSAAHAGEIPILYNGDTGPSHWSTLNPDWEECAGGADSAQSPINIKRVKRDRKLRPLDIELYPTTVDIFNNGHTIEQRYEDSGSSIYFEGVEYELQQFHFHTLSEHTIRRQHAPLEMHAVFSEPGGAILVVSQLFKKGKVENAFIGALIEAGLPEKNGDETVIAQTINLADGLTNTANYFTYQGSLTTPPCSEVVTWVILKRAARVSQAQLAAFRDILGNNFRPVQMTNGRTVRSTPRRQVSGKYSKSSQAQAAPTASKSSDK